MKIKVERLLISIFAIAIGTIWKCHTLISNEKDGITTNDTGFGSHLNNSPSNNKISESTTKPNFILHIGPPKTATTYIQCGLHKLSKALANDDSYYFVGKNCPQYKAKMDNNETSVPGHFLLMGLNDANPYNRGYEKLKARMDYHRVRGNNIIYSNEAFANHLKDQNSTWACLQTLFPGWNVRVVIGYRHYFDWIRSFYYQTHKQNANLDKKWPNHDRGKYHPSFVSFLDYHLQRKESGNLSIDGGLQNDAFGHHLTITAYRKFSPHFHNIKFLNLHDDEDMVTDFVCRILPDANNTCRKLRTAASEDKRAPSSEKRTSQSFDAFRIAEAALDKGYISYHIPKEVVVKKVKQKIKDTGVKSRKEFWICPSPSLVARLLKVSIEFENEMYEISTGGTLSLSEKEKIES